MRPIRVLVAAPSLEIVGGQSIQAFRLLEALKNRPEICVAFQPINPRLGVPFRPLQRIKYVRTLATETVYAGELFARLRTADVVHAFTAGYSSFLLTFVPLLAAARANRKPIILNYHDGRAESHFERSPLAIKLARKADRIVVPSGYLAGIFARFGLKARPIFNMIDASRFSFRERRRVKPYFLHNRGLERHYNPACSLRAFAIVQRKHPDATLDVAHDGPLRGELEALAEALGLNNVRFLGAVDQNRMRDLYDDAEIYLMSPNADNMPLSILECFASGVPLVSTAAGGVPYMVEDGRTGLLVSPNDHQALATAALRLIEEEGLALQLAANGFRECERYQPDRVAKEWCAVYSELSALKPSR
ncbi:MAG: glycosyltransferase family 4 protein [Bryobacteraceae bacterium]